MLCGMTVSLCGATETVSRVPHPAKSAPGGAPGLQIPQGGVINDKHVYFAFCVEPITVGEVRDLAMILMSASCYSRNTTNNRFIQRYEDFVHRVAADILEFEKYICCYAVDDVSCL